MQNQSKLEITFDTQLKTALKCSSELTNFPLSVRPSKENARLQEAKKKSPTAAGIEPALSGFSVIVRCSTEWATRADGSKSWVINGGNCGNVNMKGTNECCATSTKDTNARS